jgi:NAD-dependent DNA ligase
MAPRKKTTNEAKPATAKPRAPPKPSKPATKPKPKPNATKLQKAAGGRKAIWAGKVFVLSGDLHPQYNHEDIERWILHHGGRVHTEVTRETTHLICTMEEFKNKVTHGRTFSTSRARA